jgi:capsular exopolysaccharide synthesis family protein
VVTVGVLNLENTPASPTSPIPAFNLMLGGLAGLLTGVLCALAAQQLDRRLSPRDDLAELAGAPLLATVPRVGGRPQDLRIDPGARSPWAESLRMVRTNLRFVGIESEPAALVVTSATPDEGKTSIATGLAQVLADGGRRVLIIDADLRKPRVAVAFGLDSSVGLTDCLTGRVAAEGVVQQVSESSLWVLPSGRIPPNPSELLASPRMETLLADALGRFDVVIVDSPPVLPFTDAAAVAVHCRGVLLVARNRRVLRDEVLRAGEAVRAAGSKVLGTIGNGVPATRDLAYAYEYGRDGRRGAARSGVAEGRTIRR